jgi:hypothetical protein
MTDNYSLSDIAAVTDGNRNSGMFGNDSWAWIVILLLFGYGGRGFGGFGGFGGSQGGYGMPCGVPATQADLAAGFNNSAVLSGINGIDSALCQGFNGINTAILQSGYNTQTSINGLSHQLADCCCATQRAIDGVNYNLATQSCETRNTIQNTTRDVIDNANANSRAILDFLTQDKIATLTAENQSLKFAASQSAQNAYITASQEAQTAELIRRLGRDCPVPAYVVPNPNCCYNANVTFGNGCGCGSF